MVKKIREIIDYINGICSQILLIAIAVNCDWWLPLDGGGVPGGVEDGELLGGEDACRSGMQERHTLPG